MRLRSAHRLLAQEYVDIAPAGLVLAIAVRCARDLRLAGHAGDLVPDAIEHRVRAVMTARSS